MAKETNEKIVNSKVYVASFFLVKNKAGFDKIARKRNVGKITKDETLLFADFETADRVCRWFAETLLENLRNLDDGWKYRIEPSLYESMGKGYSIFQTRDVDGLERSLQAANFSFHEAVFEPELLVDRKLAGKVENAIWKNDLVALKKLVESGLSVNSKLYGNMPLLYRAVESERVAIAKYLLKNGANPNPPPLCHSPLIAALYPGNFKLFKMLLQYGAKVDYGKLTGSELFNSYHHHKDLAFTRFLVENGADVNARGEYSWTVLHQAAENGHLELVKFLVEHGADLKAKDEYGVSALNDYVKDKKIREYLKGAGVLEGRRSHWNFDNPPHAQKKKSAVKKSRPHKLTKKEIKELREDIAESENR